MSTFRQPIKFNGYIYNPKVNAPNLYSVSSDKNPYGYSIPANKEYIYFVVKNSVDENYKKIPYQVIPFKEIDINNLTPLENIDPFFKQNNPSLYDKSISMQTTVMPSIKRTYDDSFSRNATIDFFKRYFSINLIPHPGLTYNGTNNLAVDGQYCIDLVSDDFSGEVEVERNSENSPLFSNRYPEFSLIVSKFEKYFRAADGKKRFMVYILDNGEKISIISGDDIRSAYFNGVNCKWYSSKNTDRPHPIHAYMMTRGITATFDTATMQPLYIGKYCSWIRDMNSIENTLSESFVDYSL